MATTPNPTLESTSPDGTPHRIDFSTFVRLGELGIYPTRSKLIDGIVYDISPKGDAHYFAQVELVEELSDARAGRYRAGTEPTLKVDDRNGPMPDILVTPRDARIAPETADLVIEVADSSLVYDRTEKRARYAAAGVREYWIVDLQHEVVERSAGRSRSPDRVAGRRRTRSGRISRRGARSRGRLCGRTAWPKSVDDGATELTSAILSGQTAKITVKSSGRRNGPPGGLRTSFARRQYAPPSR